MEFNSYKPLRLIELFAGIGAQAKALTNLGIKYEHWRVCEWDKYAIRSYNAVHGTNFNPSDITKLTASDLNIVDTEHYNYLLTYSFPCQSLSIAGNGEGMAKGSGTRSGLLWEVERLLNECTELPQVLLMENVPQVHGAKNKEHFDQWIAFLESKGYSNYWTDLNAKNYGIPQNRNRCYMVSILGEYSYEFPQPIPLDLNLGDMLEKEVDEKYFLDGKYETISKVNDNYSLLCGGIIGKMHDVSRRVYSSEYVAPTLHTCGGGNLEPKVAVGTIIEDFYRNRETRIYKDTSPVIRASRQGLKAIDADLRIRKLTPKECWRLMGFSDEDVEKAAKVCSNSQLYKQAGNSIVVNVLMAIFKELFVPKQTRSQWLDELLGGV